MQKSTSWGGEAQWYAEHLTDPDSYHSKVILPNLMRILDLKPNESVLDLACGTGYFSAAYVQAGAKVTGVDIGKELIEFARQHVPKAQFIISSADKLFDISDQSQDAITLILAIQNIKEIKGTLAECRRVLKPHGRIIVVMNHPVMRVPKGSEWGWDDAFKKQYRRIDQYMSEKTLEIDMHPGQKKKSDTISFHRPLQFYFKTFAAAGFAVTRLEEWISHKQSQVGPRQKEEDRMRKEIPLFMMIEIKALHKAQNNKRRS